MEGSASGVEENGDELGGVVGAWRERQVLFGGDDELMTMRSGGERFGLGHWQMVMEAPVNR